MTELSDSVENAIQSVYEAGFSTDLWQNALEKLCRAMNAYGSVTVPRGNERSTVYLPFSPEIEDFTKEFVRDGWYDRDLRAERGWPLTERGVKVILDQDIVTAEDHRSDPMFNEFYLKHGLLWWSGICFEALGQQYVLSVQRTPAQGMYTEEDRRVFEHIHGHLSRAVTIAQELSLATARGGIGVLEAMDHGGILVDGLGRILEMNTTAEAMLGTGLTVLGGKLVAHDSKSDADLRSLLQRSLVEGVQPGSFVSVHRPFRTPLMVDVLPLPYEVGSQFFFAKALVVVVDPELRPVPAAERLIALYGLTKAEARVATELAGGSSLQEIAERLKIREETVRSHVKSCFSKTGTHRQGQLVALVQRASALRQQQL